MTRRARGPRGGRVACRAGAILLLLCVAGLGAACTRRSAPLPATESLADFWTAFRGAVAAGDGAAIAALARIPFTIRGPLDDDPARSLDRAALARAMGDLLAQDCGQGERPETMRDYIARLPTLPPTALDGAGRTAHVGVFVFEKFAEGWRFSAATLEP